MSEDLPDGLVVGDFKIVRRLGAGAMGVVYEAIERSLGRTVALKVLSAEKTREPSRRARFLREARAAATVQHPALPTVFRVEPHDERVYIAMELIRGRTLREVLRGGRLAIDECVRIAKAVASALGAAHTAGIVHRDIKPDNVMIGDGGVVKVLDFGIARIDEGAFAHDGDKADPLTAQGRILGTPGYMAPEQGAGGFVDARADVFALGAMLYEMVTGRPAFTGETAIDVIIASAQDPVVPVVTLRPDAPPALCALIERCLAKAPGDRPADGTALLAAFEDGPAPSPVALLSVDTLDGFAEARPALTNAPTEPSRPTPVRPLPQVTAPPPAPATPRRWPLVALALSAIGVVVALVATSSHDAPPPVVAATSPSPPAAATPPATPPPDPAHATETLITGEAPAVIPCALFETAGVEAPGGWLGAAAADKVCGRLTVYLGFDIGRTRVPPALLGYPRAPSDELPFDPYAAPELRERTLEAARKVGPLYIDGKVEVLEKSVAIEVRIVRAGRVAASARGEERELGQAVGEALRALVGRGVIVPRVDDVPGMSWNGTTKVAAEIAVLDAWEALSTGVGFGPAIDALAAFDIRPEVVFALKSTREQIEGRELSPAPPEGTGSTPLDVYLRSVGAGRSWSGDRQKVLADALAVAARDDTVNDLGRALLLSREAWLRLNIGEGDKARQLFLRAVELEPRIVDWSTAWWFADGTTWTDAAMRAARAWAPGLADAWVVNLNTITDPSERRAFYERSTLLAPGVTTYATRLAYLLLTEGKPMRALSLGARLAAGGPAEVEASEAIFAIVEASEGAFEKAHARALAALMGNTMLGNAWEADHLLVNLVSALGRMLGDGGAGLDAVAKRFLLADPPRLMAQTAAGIILVNVCGFASPEIATPCFQRLRELLAKGAFGDGFSGAATQRLDVAEHFARGDFAGAAKLFRPLIATEQGNAFASQSFDAIGDIDTASLIDRYPLETEPPYYHGASLAQVREARRMVQRRDFAAAKKLAQTVIDAWSIADAPVPAVAEMKALIAALPRTPDPKP